jgi:hypothetical protein
MVTIADEHALQPQFYVLRKGCGFEFAVFSDVQNVLGFIFVSHLQESRRDVLIGLRGVFAPSKPVGPPQSGASGHIKLPVIIEAFQFLGSEPAEFEVFRPARVTAVRLVVSAQPVPQRVDRGTG